MRNRWILIFLATALSAQTADPGRSPEEEAEWVKIRAIKTVYEEAVSANQIDKLKPYVAAGFRGVLVTGADARSFDDLVERNREIHKLIGDGGSYNVTLTYEPGTMFGDLAVANGTAEEVVVTGSGKRFEFVSKWLVNLTREDGDWKLYRVQATLDPVDNVFVQDALKFSQALYGGGGLLLGALLGFSLGRSRR